MKRTVSAGAGHWTGFRAANCLAMADALSDIRADIECAAQELREGPDARSNGAAGLRCQNTQRAFERAEQAASKAADALYDALDMNAVSPDMPTQITSDLPAESWEQESMEALSNAATIAAIFFGAVFLIAMIVRQF